MDTLLPLIKIVTIAQVFFILLFLVCIYFARLYFFLRNKKIAQTREKVKALLALHFEKQMLLPTESQQEMKRAAKEVLLLFPELVQQHSASEFLIAYTAKLSTHILLPMARKGALSKNWRNRFNATLCFQYGYEPTDKKLLLQLLRDSSPLIALNAAAAVVKYQDTTLIHSLLSIFSQSRRLQQSLILESIAKSNSDISSVVLARLSQEPDLYIRIFCYRILSKFPQKSLCLSLEEDLRSSSLDLQLAVLDYLGHCNNEAKNALIYPLAEASQWEIRARVAKILAWVHTEYGLLLLNRLLGDSQWWVRHNAALSLYQQGEPGIRILQEQSATKDAFAYETAQKILLQKGQPSC